MNQYERKEPKLMLRLISLLTALLMWVNISGRLPDANSRHNRVYQQIPLLHENLDPSLKLNSDNYQIRVTLSGSEEEVKDIDQSDISVMIDLDGLAPNSYNLPLTADNVVLPSGYETVQVQDIIPDLVRFTLVAQLKKTLSLVVSTEGQPADDYEFVEMIVSPPRVTIEGPKARVEELSLILAEPVDLTGSTANVQGRVYIDFKKQIPEDSVILEELNTLRYNAVIREKTRTLSPDQPYPIALVSEKEETTFSPAETRLKISGPITVMRWFDPAWVVAEAHTSRIVREQPQSPPEEAPDENEPETPEATSPEGEQPVVEEGPKRISVPITPRWNLPEEVKTTVPDWGNRVSKLTLTWDPAEVEVQEQ